MSTAWFTFLDSCIQHLLCSTSRPASSVPQILDLWFHPRCHHCNQFCRGSALPHCVHSFMWAWANGTLPDVILWPLCCCHRGIGHHATKKSWEVSSPGSEPLSLGTVADKPVLLPFSSWRTFREAVLNISSQTTVLHNQAASQKETKQWSGQSPTLLFVLPPSLSHPTFSFSCSPGIALLSKVAACKHLPQALPFGKPG